MGRPAPMHLSEDERDHVQVYVRRGKVNARTLTRARVLLKSDEGWTDAEIAEVLDISEQTIRNIRQRFGAGGVEAVLTDKRQERRRQALSDRQAAHLLAITCSKVPGGHDHWTLRMLAGKAVELGYVRRISPETLRQLLKKTTSAILPEVKHMACRCDSDRKCGKLAECSDKNERGEPVCPNFQPKNVWPKVRHHFHILTHLLTTHHFSCERCMADFHPLS